MAGHAMFIAVCLCVCPRVQTSTQWPKHNPSLTIPRRQLHLETLPKAVIAQPTQLTYDVFSRVEGRDDMKA